MPDQFLDGFCRPNMTLEDFKNALGNFTPCFINVGVLGVSELFSIFVFSVQLARTLGHTSVTRHRLTSVAASVQAVAAALAACGLLITLLQLNARLGEAAASAEGPEPRPVAPYEWTGFALSAGRWVALLALLLRELLGAGYVILPGRWVVRFALVLGASAEIVKARVLVAQVDSDSSAEDVETHLGYFFYLYLTYLAVQLALAGMALTWRPTARHGLLPVEGEYLPLAASEGSSHPRVGRGVPCPETEANIISYFTFGWLSPLISKGYRSPLTPDDIWALPSDDQVAHLGPQFDRLWRDELAGKGPQAASLGAVCWRLTAWLFIGAVPYKVANDAAQFVGPLFLNMLLKSLADGSPSWRGYLAASLMFLGSAAGVFADNQHFQRVMRAGFRLKAVLSAAVHRQIFELSPSARPGFSSGRVYSLAASDVESVQSLCQNAMSFLSCPVRIVVAMALLYRELGPASLTAVAVLLALLPANAMLVALSNRALKAALGNTDERTKLEAEMVSGIMVIKCSAWEEPLQDRIEAARKRELSQLWRVTVYSSVVTFMLLSVPILIPVATFAVYLVLGNQLDAARAFTCLVLFNVLRFPLFQLPMLIAQYSAARVSVGRLRDFLAADVRQPQPPSPAAEPGRTAIRLEGDFGWDPKRPPSLVDVNLDVLAGQMVAIVGSTGSGKSTLLSAILGQTQQICGPAPRVAGRVAYVPQSPFIINATVRDNILFGLPYDAARYEQAVDGACLADDFLDLPGGDLTELGDRGVNVSGGQKQRVALARALYAQPDVVLLDDPLSALDAAVGRRVFEEGIMKGLLSDRRRTVVLATNHLHFVRRADVVVVLDREGGRVAEMGPPAQLLVAEGPFAVLMKKELHAEEEHEQEEKQEGQKEDSKEQEGGKKEAEGEDGVGAGAGAAGTSGGADGQTATGAAQAAAPAAAPAAAAHRITQDERAAEGAMDLRTVGSYLAAMQVPGGAAGAAVWLLGGFAAAEVLRVATAVWLAAWTENSHSDGVSLPLHQRLLLALEPGPVAARGPMWYLGIYAAISAVQLTVQALNTLDCGRLGLAAASRLHSRLLNRLLGAPLSFFHATPLGRIVNRLTKDTADIDRNLAQMSAMAARSFLQLISTLSLVAVVAPFALPALVVIMLAFYWLYQYFQASVRQVKRLDAVARSPVMSSLTEALGGTATYLAYAAEGRATSRHAQLLDSVSAMSLVNQSMNRWLSVRLEVLGAAAALLAGSVAVEQHSSAGAAGLVMSYALQVTTSVSLTVRAASLAETLLNSVERVVEYCEIEQEGFDPDGSAAAASKKKKKVVEKNAAGGADASTGGGGGSGGASAAAPTECPPGWPSAGEVEFQAVQLRYRPGLPLVLHGVSFRTEAREKVGVVGRTGAGKSSLLGCLFRLVEVERGAVIIDGLNIARMPLRELRGRLSLIPQSPVLFTGPIRANLSPFGRHSDAELWGALRRAHLAGLVESWPAGLDTELAEGGAPLSAGQKQLLALSRALLNPAKVLVLDEATANVDVETDALIQSTLRSEFPDRTLLTIAHRLATIIDYNRILLLEAGRVLEYDTPADLLARPGSAFGRLVDETGEAAARSLRQMAAGGGAMVQHMLEAPARAALSRLASFSTAASSSPLMLSPMPSFLRHLNSVGARSPQAAGHHLGGRARAGGLLVEGGQGVGEGTPLLAAAARAEYEGGFGGHEFGEGWMAEAEVLAGGSSLQQLAGLVAGRSRAVAQMVKGLRREVDLQEQQLLQRQRQRATAAGSIGAGVDDIGMVLAAGAGMAAAPEEDDVVVSSGGGEDGSGGGGTKEASLAAARMALARCLALLEEARLGAAALQKVWAAAGMAGGDAGHGGAGGVGGGGAAAGAGPTARDAVLPGDAV